MNARSYLFSTILVVVVFLGFTGSLVKADGAKDKTSCTTAAWPHEGSDLDPHPGMVFGRLDNGFRYIVLKNQYPKDRTALLLNVNVGSLYEDFSENGIAHFLEHMLFNGSTHFEPGELIDFFQDIGMSFGGDTNAYTTYEDTVYKIILPASDSEMLGDGLLVMSDYARGALLGQEEIERERGVILSEMNERDTASFRSYKARTRFSFEGSLLPQRFAIGRKDVLERLNRQELKKFYDTWYRPDNMVLVMVGDFDTGLAESLIQERFATLQGADEKVLCPDYGTVNHEGTKAFFHYEPDLGYSTVSIETVRNHTPQNDTFSYQVKNLYRYMAARIINFRLDQERERADSVLSSGRFYFGSTLERFQQSAIMAQTAGTTWREALAVINKLVNQVIKYGFTDEEMEMVRNEFVSHLQRALQTKDSQNSLDLAHSIVGSLNSNRVFQSPGQEKNLYTKLIMSATTDDLHQAFLDAWRPDMRLVAVIGDTEIDDDDPVAAVKNYYTGLAQQEVLARVNEKIPHFPYVPAMAPVKPEKQEYLQTAGATRYLYRNGTVLNLKKTLFKENSLSMAIHFGDGEKSLPAGGMSLLADAVINGSGTGSLKESELKMLLSGSSVRYQFHVGEESFRLAGQSLTTDSETLFQILQASILDPGLREDAFKTAMKRFDLMYKRMKGDVSNGSMLYLQPFFAGNTITHGVPAEEEFKALTIQELKAWLKPQFDNAPLEITIVGDFDQNEMVALCSRYFGPLSKRKYQFRKPTVLPHFPVGEKLEKTVYLDQDKGLVQMAWLTEDYWQIERTRRFNLLAAIIDERLRKLIREESGDSYSPAAFSSNSRIYQGYGKIVAEVVTDGASLPSVVDQIQQVVQSLHETPISREELERSKQPLLTSIRDRMKTNDYWLSSVLSLSTRHPRQLDWSQTLLEDYRSISVDDLSSLVKKYLIKERLAIGIIKAVKTG